MFLFHPAFAKNDCSILFNLTPISDAETKLAMHNNDFIVHRDFKNYVVELGSPFRIAISELGKGDIWVNFGAGQRNAELDYLQGVAIVNPEARVYAIDFVKPELSAFKMKFEKKFIASGQLVNITGRLIEDIPLTELPRFDVGSDLFGPISYTENLSTVLNTYLSLMQPMKSELFVRTLPSTYIITTDRKVLTLGSWLGRIKGLQRVWTGAMRNQFMIAKLEESVQLPSLQLVAYNAAKPPLRIFAEEGSVLEPEKLTFRDAFRFETPFSDPKFKAATKYLKK